MSAAPVENKKTIQLKTKDDEIIVVALDVAMQSSVIERLIEDLNLDTDKDDTVIPLPGVGSSELTKIIGFLENHMDDDSTAEKYRVDLYKKEMKAFDAEFIKMDNADMIAVYLAANFLGCDNLKELCSHAIAASIKGMTPDEMNKFWDYEADLTPEEEEEIRNEKPPTTA